VNITQLPYIKDIYAFLGSDVTAGLVGLLIIASIVPLNVAFLVLVERKVAGHIQLRPGPMEVGPHGILQTLIDAVKLLGKELVTPQGDRPGDLLFCPHHCRRSGLRRICAPALQPADAGQGCQRRLPDHPGLFLHFRYFHPHGRLVFQQQIFP